jgi:hypothetical protein
LAELGLAEPDPDEPVVAEPDFDDEPELDDDCWVDAAAECVEPGRL